MGRIFPQNNWKKREIGESERNRNLRHQTNKESVRSDFKKKMKVLVKYNGVDYQIKDVSKAMSVRNFRKLVQKTTEVEPKSQVLLFGGKMFQDECDLRDYRIENDYIIILQKRQPLTELELPVASTSNRELSKDQESSKEEEEKKNEATKLSKEEEMARLQEIATPELLKEMQDESKEEEICKKCK